MPGSKDWKRATNMSAGLGMSKRRRGKGQSHAPTCRRMNCISSSRLCLMRFADSLLVARLQHANLWAHKSLYKHLPPRHVCLQHSCPVFDHVSICCLLHSPCCLSYRLPCYTTVAKFPLQTCNEALLLAGRQANTVRTSRTHAMFDIRKASSHLIA